MDYSNSIPHPYCIIGHYVYALANACAIISAMPSKRYFPKELLELDADKIRGLAQEARAVVGNSVFLRAIIEISNICTKDCLYCGLRKSNQNIKRYSLPADDIIQLSMEAFQAGYRSIVLQSGEDTSEGFSEQISRIISEIKSRSNGKMRVVLSLGEQPYRRYKLWRSLGADRYLLRIETSSPSLYRLIHPKDGQHSFEKRKECILQLKALGYQIGTGVMVGLPGQSVTGLAKDMEFFEEAGIDMVAVGPYIPHEDTPLYKKAMGIDIRESYYMTLKMIAACRIYMPDVNIAATTAMDAIMPNGRIEAISYGANVIMPNITPETYRGQYELYPNKPSANGLTKGYLEDLSNALSEKNFGLDKDSYGDPIHYLKRNT